MTGLIPGNLADRGGTISQGDGDSGGLFFLSSVPGNVDVWLGIVFCRALVGEGAISCGRRTRRQDDGRDQMPHKEKKFGD